MNGLAIVQVRHCNIAKPAVLLTLLSTKKLNFDLTVALEGHNLIVRADPSSRCG